MVAVVSSVCCPQEAQIGPGDRLPRAQREVRAAWVATVANIDWPSRPGLSVAKQKRELDAILDRARDLRLNLLIFQVRPMCDAFYLSSFEPWSEWLTGVQGKAPEPPWDPLLHAVSGAHARGLELHAWFNPFRARHEDAQSLLDRMHPARRMRRSTVTYGKQVWLDPGSSASREHSLRVILDVVRRYDIDGVHLDDYFYPYPLKGKDFPDDRTWRRYVGEGGSMSRGEWRRANIDTFISSLHTAIKKSKRWVKLGISPFGIARPGMPRGIEAGVDQYEQLYADPAKWLAKGWCDYIAPQLYWPIGKKTQSYPVLLEWWARQNPLGRHVWPGNLTSKVGSSAVWSAGELVNQIAVTRATDGVSGNLHFSMRALRDTPAGIGGVLARGVYREPALVPPSPWLDGVAPRSPSLRVLGRPDRVFSWSIDPDVRIWAVYLERAGEWDLVATLPAETCEFRLSDKLRQQQRITAFAVSGVDRCGNESEPTVQPLR